MESGKETPKIETAVRHRVQALKIHIDAIAPVIAVSADERRVVIRADARTLPLPDGCADLIVTSPPYFGLRSYTDDGAHYGGQIGSEATPAEWLAALVACTREWVRVLKPSGSLFVNLYDKYADPA